MNLAKVSANGQVTVPVDIRRKLQLKEGDKLLFIERDGEIVINHASATAILPFRLNRVTAGKIFTPCKSAPEFLAGSIICSNYA